ncbi:DUF4838 domain-containing protein [Oleiharenicola lentus]|uniref:DUF4838 domain-containing protein n=1 Tax=Oleiharenicola lentus TaxID=2508720 RepID=UPI003F67B05D
MTNFSVIFLRLGVFLVGATLASAAGIEVVRDGHAHAVIVTSAQPTRVAAYAASEIVYHVEKATGVKLAVVKENAVPTDAAAFIYVGDTKAARPAGIAVEQLAPETFRLLTAKNALIIAGHDGAGDPLDNNTSAGTLFGVYEWLERDLGVRWAWPGELGTFVPKTKTLTISAFDETTAPRFLQRNVRPGLAFESAHPALGFTPAAAKGYAEAQTIFLRRNRMGRSYPLSYRHAFTDWWEKYGATHPEWFQLVNGRRGPTTPKARFSMCVSNPGLHQKIVDLWLEQGGATVKGRPNLINIVENDFLGSCECEECRAWDGAQQPPDRDKFYAPNFKVYGARYMSNRYARFSAAVLALAKPHNANVTVVSYSYFNYFQAPNEDIPLGANAWVGYCPSAGWYPRGTEENQWYQDQWLGWEKTGARQFVRTNYFLDGYSMPFIFARQFAQDFQFQAKHGMFGTDFDSLTGQWSTQGPSLYLLMRLHTRPTANVDDLLNEYYSVFGPATTQVKAYFDYWENYTMGNRERINAIFEDRVAIRWRTWAKAAHRVFPPEALVAGEALLAKALAAAQGNAEATARVNFLATGLAHAKLCGQVAALLTTADPASTAERGNAALTELLRFRRAHEKEWFANLNHNAWVEDISWQLSAETKQEPEYYP